jgi:hypothetical protein
LSRLACLLILVIQLACHSATPDATPLFQLMDNTGINFDNQIADGQKENSFLFRNFYNGGGVAIGDINNDGLPDVFLTSNMGDNKLYLNKGSFHFDDITAKAGFHQDSMWSTGAVMVDINNDGWLDIYVCNSGHMENGHRKNKLYINNHDNSFTESAARYGLDISAYTTQVSFFDYDNDGDLDCFMINNSPIPVNTLNNSNRRDLPDAQWPVANFLKGGGDHLFRNDNGHFTEVTKEAGIHGSLISFGLGVSVADVNNDGYPDIFVSNDSYERDYLYINQKNGTFKDEMEDCLGHTSFSSMGADIADINNDGAPEIFTTDMLPEDDYRLKTLGAFDNIDLYNAKLKSGFYHQYMKNCLQLNDGHGKFIDIANYSGVSATDWSWGALLFDMDNDGRNDIYVCNGVNKDVTNLDFMDFFADDVMQKMVLTGKKDRIEQILEKIPVNPMIHKAYRNEDGMRFSDQGIAWGFTQKSFANGAAYADLDNDGDLDLVINNINGPAFIYRNNARQTNKNHYLGISLRGHSSNTFAIGSKIKAYRDHEILYRELVPSRGFQSSVDYKQIIGLGNNPVIDSLIIIWPDRSIEKINKPAIDTVYSLQQPANAAQPPTTPTAANNAKPLVKTILTPLAASFDKHEEDDNEDFHYEHNLPKMLSREGPKAARGDVNGDGLTDVYIGGTSKHPGQLYLQTADGHFIRSPQPDFNQFPEFEDEATIFFDADHDGDLDLFIGPGGNNNRPFSREMQFRLFLNDGKGHFTLAPGAFPPTSNGGNTGVAVAADFNNDGALDLFIGGRSVPREYGANPSSFIYLNDGHAHFTDIAPTKNPDIAHIGMVTSACWADLTGEGHPQLLITGEWMAPRLFHFQNDHFIEINTNLNHLFGWWQSALATDLDGDGRPDLVLGNIGENFYLRPDSAHPVKLWVNDFDHNGIRDKIMTRTVDKKDMPVFLKRDMEMQLPAVKKQNLRHAEYAKRTIQQLLPGEDLDSAMVKLFNYPASVIAFNLGNGRFRIQPLPARVQLSSVCAIATPDLNGDGHPDLVLGGNEFGFLPQFGRLDGSMGDILLNNGKGRFSWIFPDSSGLELPGQVRDIAPLKAKAHQYLLFLRNDDYPVLYSYE